MKLKNLVKACSKDKFRCNLQNINVRHEEGIVVCEATDGHVCVQMRYPTATAPQPLATLAVGQYTPGDWTDLVCKERSATPIDDTPTFCDIDQVTPSLEQYDASLGVKAIGIDPKLIAVVASIIDTQSLKFCFLGQSSPIRIDHEDPDTGCKVTAIIMPYLIH